MARKLSHQRKNTFQISWRAESECGWTNSVWTCGRGKFLNPQRQICRFKSIRILVDRALDIPPPIVFISACTKSKLCAFSRFLTDLSGTSDVKKDSYFHLLKTLSTFLCLSARLAHKATFFLSEIKCTKELLLVPLTLNKPDKPRAFSCLHKPKKLPAFSYQQDPITSCCQLVCLFACYTDSIKGFLKHLIFTFLICFTHSSRVRHISSCSSWWERQVLITWPSKWQCSSKERCTKFCPRACIL